MLLLKHPRSHQPSPTENRQTRNRQTSKTDLPAPPAEPPLTLTFFLFGLNFRFEQAHAQLLRLKALRQKRDTRLIEGFSPNMGFKPLRGAASSSRSLILSQTQPHPPAASSSRSPALLLPQLYAAAVSLSRSHAGIHPQPRWPSLALMEVLAEGDDERPHSQVGRHPHPDCGNVSDTTTNDSTRCRRSPHLKGRRIRFPTSRAGLLSQPRWHSIGGGGSSSGVCVCGGGE